MLYRVEGLTFSDGAAAERYARMLALRDGRKVHVLEKLDDMTPWHISCTITAEL